MDVCNAIVGGRKHKRRGVAGIFSFYNKFAELRQHKMKSLEEVTRLTQKAVLRYANYWCGFVTALYCSR